MRPFSLRIAFSTENDRKVADPRPRSRLRIRSWGYVVPRDADRGSCQQIHRGCARVGRGRVAGRRTGQPEVPAPCRIVGNTTRGDDFVTSVVPIPGSDESLTLATAIWQRPNFGRPTKQPADVDPEEFAAYRVHRAWCPMKSSTVRPRPLRMDLPQHLATCDRRPKSSCRETTRNGDPRQKQRATTDGKCRGRADGRRARRCHRGSDSTNQAGQMNPRRTILRLHTPHAFLRKTPGSTRHQKAQVQCRVFEVDPVPLLFVISPNRGCFARRGSLCNRAMAARSSASPSSVDVGGGMSD